MRMVSAFCAVIGLVICVAQANAAQPSASKLSQMGLSGATIVSDSDAMSVRGFGYRGGNKVTIYGRSSIEVKVYYPVKVEIESTNGYHSTTGGSQIGANVSVVGVAVIGGGNGIPNGGEGGGAAFNGGGMNGGHGGVPIIFAGGASGVWVPGGRR
jgi:hypothetical protein